MFKKKYLPWTILVVVLVLLLGAGLGYVLSVKSGIWDEATEYSAVYLATGDIYFGELHWFPRLHLKNAWYLQQGLDENNQAQLGILPFREVAWGPQDKIYLSSDQIIWTARVRSDGQLGQALLSGQAQAISQQP